MSEQPEPKWITWLEWAILWVIIALATFLRYWQLGDVPPGFNSDEAVGAIGALTTLREGLQYSYEGQGGGGALGFYFAAAAFYLFGPSIESIRGLAAWAGVMSIFANYWAIREVFRLEGLNRARVIAGLGTLGLAVTLWHVNASRIAFAGIGVPFLMLPSVYFLWRGLNHPDRRWPFVVSGLFLGALMYIYLAGVFAPPLYAAFFIGQWLIVLGWRKLAEMNLPITDRLRPPTAYLTTQFWHIFTTALIAIILLLPIIYVLLTRPELEPGTERVSQAFFMNPQINRGDPWGLLWRSIIGNLGAYGVSWQWLLGERPRLALFMPAPLGLTVFLGFLIAFIQSLRGRAAYLFIWLWFIILLLPSILSPDVIPHHLRTIGATTPTFVFAALTVVHLFEGLWWLWQRMKQGSPLQQFTQADRLAYALGIALAALLGWQAWQINQPVLADYFYVYPKTNDAQAAYHVYAVEMAEVINAEPNPEVAFILPRNTAAGDVFRNFTTDFLVELEQPPATHYWVIDDETTLAADLTAAAQDHSIIKVVHWKTSKHTGADPKEVIPYYLEKYGHYVGTAGFEYFDIATYQLETESPVFSQHETLTSQSLYFNDPDQQTGLWLTGYALGDASQVSQVAAPTVNSNDLLWVRLAWRLENSGPENLKASLLLYAQNGQLVQQVDKLLQSNILQVGSSAWPPGAEETTYFLVDIPPATPPGQYTLRLAVYGERSLARLPVNEGNGRPIGGLERAVLVSHLEVKSAQTPVDPEELDLALPVGQELQPGLTLLGFETLPAETVRAGETLYGSVIWQAGDPPPMADLRMTLAAKAGEGETEWQLSEAGALASPTYPTTDWRAGEILRGWLTARIPPTLEPGRYKLRLDLTAADSSAEPVMVLPIGDFQVEGWPRNFDAPTPLVDLQATFYCPNCTPNDQVTLVGLDAEAEQLSAGDTLQARLYWRADSELAENYTAFVHLIGPDGLLYGQVDQTPGGGAYPTTGWLKGEYITDEYTIPLAPNAPPGAYQIEIGMYNPQTGQRLTLSQCQAEERCDSANNRVLLGGLTVSRAP